MSSSHMNRRLKSQTSLCSEVARPCFNDGRQTIQIHYYQVFVFGDNFVLYGAITYYDYAYTASTPDAWLHKKENTSNSESKAPPTAQKLLHRHESGRHYPYMRGAILPALPPDKPSIMPPPVSAWVAAWLATNAFEPLSRCIESVRPDKLLSAKPRGGLLDLCFE